MKKEMSIGIALLLSACGSSGGDGSSSEATLAPLEATQAATDAAAVPIPSDIPSAEPVLASVSTEVWRCDGGKYKLEFTTEETRTNPRGGDEVSGKYKIKGDNYLGIANSGDFYMKGAAYILGDVWFQPSDDGKSIWWEHSESGNVSECVK